MGAVKNFFIDYYSEETPQEIPDEFKGFFDNQIEDIIVPLSEKEFASIQSRNQTSDFNDVRPVNFLYHNHSCF